MDAAAVLDVLNDAADSVRAALDGLGDWGLSGTRVGQYRSDLVADEACLSVLADAGFGWLSEESGVEGPDRQIVVIVDPLDGSTNAARGIPWYATSLCALDAEGPLAAVVVNQATGRRYSAIRGKGATVDGEPMTPSTETRLDNAIVGMSGYPRQYLGWSQFRALGAAALDLCAVAEGVLDGYLDASPSAHGAWDYAGGLLICTEAGAHVAEAFDRDLLTLDHTERRTPLAAGTAELLAELVAGRQSLHWPEDPWVVEV